MYASIGMVYGKQKCGRLNLRFEHNIKNIAGFSIAMVVIEAQGRAIGEDSVEVPRQIVSTIQPSNRFVMAMHRFKY